jgi:hypothetical protein
VPEKTIQAIATVIPMDKKAEAKSAHSIIHSETLKAGAGGNRLVLGSPGDFSSALIYFCLALIPNLKL